MSERVRSLHFERVCISKNIYQLSSKRVQTVFYLERRMDAKKCCAKNIIKSQNRSNTSGNLFQQIDGCVFDVKRT